MGIVGGITTGGLWLLGVPLAPALGLFAALAEFVPNVGPFLAFIPALVLALTESATRALAVLLLYLGVQGFESYVLTPLVEKRAVALPPALTITAQVLMAVLAGGLGLALATPLAAAALVLVQRLYVEDTLGDALEVPPSPSLAREASRRRSLARSVRRVVIPVACGSVGWTGREPSACRPRDGAGLSPGGAAADRSQPLGMAPSSGPASGELWARPVLQPHPHFWRPSVPGSPVLLAPLGSRKLSEGHRQPASPMLWLGCSRLASLLHPLAPEGMVCTRLPPDLNPCLCAEEDTDVWAVDAYSAGVCLEHRPGDAGRSGRTRRGFPLYKMRDVLGQAVTTPQGKEVGHIENVVLDAATGDLLYCVVTSGVCWAWAARCGRCPGGWSRVPRTGSRSRYTWRRSSSRTRPSSTTTAGPI